MAFLRGETAGVTYGPNALNWERSRWNTSEYTHVHGDETYISENIQVVSGIYCMETSIGLPLHRMGIPVYSWYVLRYMCQFLQNPFLEWDANIGDTWRLWALMIIL
jgi:hypothetical protein